MGLAIPRFFQESDGRVDVTFRERFRAWWDGYELAARSANGAHDPAEALPDVDEDVRPLRPPGTLAESAPREAWPKPRRDVVQMIWGDGFTLLGGEGYVQDLVSAFSLSPADSVLEFGSGMGGGTAAIVGRFGAYMNCFERDAALREIATARAITLGVDDKVKTEPFRDRPTDLRENFFLGALVREVLCTVADKEDFLFRIAQSLKAEGQLVITDLIFEPDDAAPELREWLDAEPRPYFPTTVDFIRDTCTKYGIVVRTAADEGDAYRRMAIDGWLKLLSRIDSTLDPVLADALVAEAEMWARRIAAIDAGALRYYRFVGVKKA